ncbi:MAG: hypothetical protein LBL74_00310 [Bacteroidales bacterium]|jgi:hypothetical protein|nr:hypothetical protein [Bacteroidales bacterium]
MNAIIKQYYYYFVAALIVVVSFLLYSSNFYPSLNSDDALNILMAHYYDFPNEIYYWHQNRGGGIIPLIAQIFIQLFGCKAITAVSVSNYLMLILGYCGFASLFKKNNIKILFAVIWFLPFQRFVDITRFYVGMEYCIIGIAVWLINLLYKAKWRSTKWHLLFISVILILTIAVWVLDTAAFSIAILIVTLWIYSRKLRIKPAVMIYVAVGIAFCWFAIHFAKSFTSVTCEHCTQINNLSDVVKAIDILIAKYKDVLLFRTNEIMVSSYFWAVCAFLIAFAVFLSRKSRLQIIIREKWITFFILDFLAFFGIYLLSHHVLLNDMGRWYYVANYISLSIAILLIIDRLQDDKKIRFFRYAVWIIALIGAISPYYTLKVSYQQPWKPKAEVVSELQQLGNIGIIAEYWNAYIVSIENPEQVKSTPHQDDWEWRRNKDLVKQTMERDNIYVIKDMWLKTFPDTLHQFGYTLLKDGNQFRLADSWLCKYRKISNTK